MLFTHLISTVSVRSFRRVGQRVGQTRKPSAKTAPQESKITGKTPVQRSRSVLTIPLPDESPNRDIPPTKSRQQASGDTTPWFVHPGAAPQLLVTK